MFTLIVWNILVFLLYGIDKYRAVKNRWRISEKALLTCAVLMGGIGAFLGMEIFRHKTRKIIFKIVVPLSAILEVAVIFYGRIEIWTGLSCTAIAIIFMRLSKRC